MERETKRKNHKWTMSEIQQVEEYLKCNTSTKLAQRLNLPVTCVVGKMNDILKRQRQNSDI